MRSNKSRLIIICILIIGALVTGGRLFLKSKYVIPVLMYHSIDARYKETKLSVSPLSFEEQMKFLHNQGYNAITLKELVDTIKDKTAFPAKTVAVTFDDGYEDNYLYAFPALKKYGIPATIFVVVDNIGKEGFLNWDQINEMVESGLVAIGNHTSTHAYLPSLSDDKRLISEVLRSKNILEKKIGQENIFFSYPVGGFTGKVKLLVEEAGYAGACAVSPGRRYPDDDIYALKRVRISRTADSQIVFRLKISGYHTFIKEIRDED